MNKWKALLGGDLSYKINVYAIVGLELYNLGIIDNRTATSSNPLNEFIFDDLWDRVPSEPLS